MRRARRSSLPPGTRRTDRSCSIRWAQLFLQSGLLQCFPVWGWELLVPPLCEIDTDVLVLPPDVTESLCLSPFRSVSTEA